MPSEWIYVLLCNKEKYYVGKTGNVKRRLGEHMREVGAWWTKRYPPIRILDVIESDSPFNEDKIVKEYMSYAGIDNVRGGSYCRLHLNKDERKMIQKEIWGAENKCLVCGGLGHFVSACTKLRQEAKAES